MILVLMGAPGAGKGTQADLIEAKSSFKKISTGDILRKHIKNQTEIGKSIKTIMDSGNLVSDDILLEVLKFELNENVGKKVLLDGFPRNLKQAKSLQKISDATKNPIVNVIHIEVGFPELIQRISGRRVCGSCGAGYHISVQPPKKKGVCDKCQSSNLVIREDDQEERVKHRLSIFEKDTSPVFEFYKQLNLYTPVDGTLGIDDVFSLIKKIIDTSVSAH